MGDWHFTSSYFELPFFFALVLENCALFQIYCQKRSDVILILHPLESGKTLKVSLIVTESTVLNMDTIGKEVKVMDNFNNLIDGLEIEQLSVSDMVNSTDMTEDDANQIMGASCTTCTCTCSCCTT